MWEHLHSAIEGGKHYLNGVGYLTSERWRKLLYRWHVEVEHNPADEFKHDYKVLLAKVKSLVYTTDFGRFYRFLETIAENPEFRNLTPRIAEALTASRAAWRLVETEIVPVTSEEQGEAVSAAVSTLLASGPEGAKAHLRSSGQAIADGDWAGSVRESIHAVESVARSLTGSGTLSDALRELQRSGRPIHPALASGFRALYGYTSDENGVRHALLETSTAAVTEDEALFMYSACASFCQYLLNTARNSE